MWYDTRVFWSLTRVASTSTIRAPHSHGVARSLMAANPAPAGIEAKPAQLGEKLLERALEDQESARKSLVREMKVGFLILLLFQLWMLPRFVSFSDAIDTNNK